MMAGKVPAVRAPYGYKYRRDAKIDERGRVKVLRAWWEVDELGPDGEPLHKSPAWVVAQIFSWAGDEGRTTYWIANKLTAMGIASSEGTNWTPGKVGTLLKRKSYTGKARYNENGRAPNPDRPLGDLTLGIPRTVIRPKPDDSRPENHKVAFTVPPLVGEDQWQRANTNLSTRGRGTGKQGQSINALLRNRIFCPICCRPLIVRRNGQQKQVYYYCSKYFRPWAPNPCSFRRFIPSTWEDLIWGDICTWLRDEAWVEEQLTSEVHQGESMTKVVRLQQYRVSQAKAKVRKVQEGYERDIYTLEEAKHRLDELHETITRGEQEILRLEATRETTVLESTSLEAMKDELRSFRDKNLEDATFEEKLEVVSKFGIKVYPSEDLKSMKVLCNLNLNQFQSKTRCGNPDLATQADGGREPDFGCGKVLSGTPFSIIISRTTR